MVNLAESSREGANKASNCYKQMKVTFAPIEYTRRRWTHTYTVKEVVGNNSVYTYDKTG